MSSTPPEPPIELGGGLSSGIARWLISKGLSEPETLRPDLGKLHAPEWLRLARSIATIGGVAAGAMGHDQALALIRALSGIQDAQNSVLQELSRDVKLLRLASYNTGTEQLAIAERSQFGSAEYFSRLKKAEDRFIEALNLSVTQQESALVLFHIGMVAQLTGDLPESLYRLEQCYKECRQTVATIISTTKPANSRVDLVRDTVLFMGLGPIGGALAFTAKGVTKDWSHERAVQALQAFAPFVTTVVAALNQLAPDVDWPGLRITGGPSGVVVIDWTL